MLFFIFFVNIRENHPQSCFFFASWQFCFNLAGDGEGGGGPLLDHVGTILDFYYIFIKMYIWLLNDLIRVLLFEEYIHVLVIYYLLIILFYPF